MVKGNDLVQAVALRVKTHLAEIGEMFNPGTKLTLVARNPELPDGSQDFVITADNLPDVMTALKIRHDAELRATGAVPNEFGG